MEKAYEESTCSKNRNHEEFEEKNENSMLNSIFLDGWKKGIYQGKVIKKLSMIINEIKKLNIKRMDTKTN